MVTDKTSLCRLQRPALSEKIVTEMVWDPKVGFKIPYGSYTIHTMLTCKTVVNGREFKAMYIPKRLSESVVFLSSVLLIEKVRQLLTNVFLCFTVFFCLLSPFYSSCS